jgi:hypothetical protein
MNTNIYGLKIGPLSYLTVNFGGNGFVKSTPGEQTEALTVAVARDYKKPSLYK